MKTIKAIIPQVVFETVTFELPDDEADEIQHMGCHERADLIIKHMTDSQYDWLPNGKKSLEQALDIGFSTISGHK